jgi:hypothetical protein
MDVRACYSGQVSISGKPSKLEIVLEAMLRIRPFAWSEGASITAYTYSTNVVMKHLWASELVGSIACARICRDRDEKSLKIGLGGRDVLLGDLAEPLARLMTLLVRANITPDYAGPLFHHQNNSFTWYALAMIVCRYLCPRISGLEG